MSNYDSGNTYITQTTQTMKSPEKVTGESRQTNQGNRKHPIKIMSIAANSNNRSPNHKLLMEGVDQTQSNCGSSSSNISENVVPKESINHVISFDSNPSFVHVNK
jgi:hypothetical protein